MSKDLLEEAVTSSEFDKFLEERAAAAESLPNIPTSDNNGTEIDANYIDNSKRKQPNQPQVSSTSNTPKKTDDLLL